MTKYVPTKIINAHAHYHPGELEQRAEQWKAAGLLATCICAASEAQNQPVLDLRKRFGSFVIPFGYVALGHDNADAVNRLKDRGFVGLKFLHSPVPYSDPRLFPIYERAAELKMPGMFHTGWAAGAKAKRSLNMMPSELEPVCKSLPEWKFVAAHLGNWWAQDAVGLMEYHPNIYFDLSGGFIRKQSPTWLRSLFLRQPEKNLRRIEEVVDHSLIARLVFATDNPPLEELLEFYVNLLNWLEVPVDVQNKVYYDNIAQILAEANYEPPAHT